MTLVPPQLLSILLPKQPGQCLLAAPWAAGSTGESSSGNDYPEIIPNSPAHSSVAQGCPHFRLGKQRPSPRGSTMKPNLLMELDSNGIKSTSEIASPLQSASALEEMNQKKKPPGSR